MMMAKTRTHRIKKKIIRALLGRKVVIRPHKTNPRLLDSWINQRKKRRKN